eukprot:4727895-Pyramimonas_sp.AAC.1
MALMREFRQPLGPGAAHGTRPRTARRTRRLVGTMGMLAARSAAAPATARTIAARSSVSASTAT